MTTDTRNTNAVVRSLRRAVLGDESILRDLRLRALSDQPEAFGSTYNQELARTTSDWQRWLSTGVTFILESEARGEGIVAGLHDQADPSIVHLMAMWVDPGIRGSEAADRLVGAVLEWARSDGAKLVRLKVIKTNNRARRFYERNGFRPTGRSEIRERDGLIELEMERSPTNDDGKDRGSNKNHN
ncbi:MAG: GNAT family N-acetyltransferase [Steroidobacteraceae bacterium]|jgi:ribosomal protein S18 acetylase RimI-like enzyme